MDIVKVKDPCADVRALRLAQKENQQVFWGRFGLGQSAGSRYECGRPIPPPVSLLLEIRYGKRGPKVLAELQG